jgi:hypothetical protein
MLELALFFTAFFGYILVTVWLREQPWWQRFEHWRSTVRSRGSKPR